MGFAASPQNSIRMAFIAEEMYKENQHQTGKGADNKELNPFKGDSVRLNLNLPVFLV